MQAMVAIKVEAQTGVRPKITLKREKDGVFNDKFTQVETSLFYAYAVLSMNTAF